MCEMKACTKCKGEFPATTDYFHKTRNTKSGLRGSCKKCENESIAAYYVANRESRLEYHKQWSKDNKESIAKRKKKYRKDNIEKLAEYKKQYCKNNRKLVQERSKEYREKNKETIARWMKRYYDENRSLIRERWRRYRELNKERISQKNRQWRQENKDRVNVLTQRRRAKIHSLEHTLTLRQWEDLKTEFNNLCAYCGMKKPLVQDHFIPLKNGGEYSINNIVPSCGSCNSKKSSRQFFEWYPEYKYYSKKREQKVLKYLGYTNGIQQLSLM